MSIVICTLTLGLEIIDLSPLVGRGERVEKVRFSVPVESASITSKSFPVRVPRTVPS